MFNNYAKETYYNNICVTYYRNGVKSLTKLKNGYIVRRRYSGYTTKECLKMFNQYYKNEV